MLCLLPACAVSIASVIGFLREPFISFAMNIAHHASRLNPRNPTHSGHVALLLPTTPPYGRCFSKVGSPPIPEVQRCADRCQYCSFGASWSRCLIVPTRSEWTFGSGSVLVE